MSNEALSELGSAETKYAAAFLKTSWWVLAILSVVVQVIAGFRARSWSDHVLASE
jgi:hypothetical protein